MKREDLILNNTIEEVVLNMCTMKLCYQATHSFWCLPSQNNQLNMLRFIRRFFYDLVAIFVNLGFRTVGIQ